MSLLRSSSSRTIKLHDDIMRGPIKIINKRGKVVGTYRK
jgi:hypothetical protein